jgi:hypothetical protein
MEIISYLIYGVVIGSVLLGFIIHLFDKKVKVTYNFKYKVMPTVQPVPIPTKGKGFWGALMLWLLGSRQWQLTKDWKYDINGIMYVIPKGFVFDGASIPKFFRTWLSPVGVLMMGGLVHDYAYKYKTILKANKKDTIGPITQKHSDQLFKDINISVNGFRILNYIGYAALRLGGYFAWSGHRKRNLRWEDSV